MFELLVIIKRCVSDVLLLKIAVAILFIGNLGMLGCMYGLYKVQEDILSTNTVNFEIQKVWGVNQKDVWQLQEVPAGELK